VVDQQGSAIGATPAWDDNLGAGRPRGFPWPPLILIGIVVVASVVAIGVRSLGGEADGPKVLTDAVFMSAATAECRAAFPPLRPVSTDRDDIQGAKEIAEQSRRAADGLASLSMKLRSLPVASQDAPFVVSWQDDWNTFIDSGRRYAAQLDTGDVRAANKVATGGDKAQSRADSFARANGLKDCQLRAVFVAPPRRSPL